MRTVFPNSSAGKEESSIYNKCGTMETHARHMLSPWICGLVIAGPDPQAVFLELVSERWPSRLAVLRVDDAFWSDWGVEHRILKDLHAMCGEPA